MNTKPIYLLLSLLSVVGCLLKTAPLHAASGPVVSAVSFLQDVVINPGPRRVTVTYTIAHPNSLPCTVFLEADRDGTGVYEQLTAVSGAVGEGLDTSPGGLVKTAVWDVGASAGWAKVLYPTVRLRVTATTSAATTSRNFFTTVGDAGNAADPTTGYGAVGYTFQIQKFEFTNAEYVEFLNAVGGTNPNRIYSSLMGSDPRGGITQSGVSPNFTYATKANMGDKPVNFVSWFEAARVANWLHNGRSTDPALLERGAYTLNNATSGVGFIKNVGATYWIPSEDEWYKAAYYKGEGVAPGYWLFPTKSDIDPTYVKASSTGVGSAGLGSMANSINGYESLETLHADWNGQIGNVTTVGSNGGPSTYGTYDMGGNVWEWNEAVVSGAYRVSRGGSWGYNASGSRSNLRSTHNADDRFDNLGFRLARGTVPPPSVLTEFVTVGDAGNAADNRITGQGAVGYTFEIQKFEFTNREYVEFLNTVGGTNPNEIYSSFMGSDALGGITQSGASPNFTYAVKPNMADKPVNFVSWFEAARVANWLHNGRSTDPALLESGAYTLNNATNGVGFTKNVGARYWVPSDDEWYKAAYYKGGGVSAGYWIYPTKSDTEPTYVTANPTGVGSAGLGSTANSLNGSNIADWNGQDGNVTTVGSNGGPSAYGTYDMGGNVWEWGDALASGSLRAFRGGGRSDPADFARSGSRGVGFPDSRRDSLGFRLARSPVP